MPHQFESLCVVGLGYIGLPTAAVFASRGLQVIGVDINERTVQTINRGEVPIAEPELDVLVRGAVVSGKLKAFPVPHPADAFIIAAPTPLKDGHKPDLSDVENATRSLAPVLKAGDLIVLESTSPVGTTERLAGWLADLRPDLRFPVGTRESAEVDIAYCPERVMPGRVLRELTENARIVGGLTPAATQRAVALYRVIAQGECIETDARTAELTKLAENACRDVNIAFANELSLVCDRLGIDVWELIALANRHPRVNILKPGPGVGGHCIAVDPWFIVDSAPEEARLIRTAREVNDSKPQFVVRKAIQAARGLKAPAIACLGLAYKADVDDLRESPAVKIVRELTEAGDWALHIVEPYVQELPPELRFDGRIRLTTLEQALSASQVVVLLTDHRQFGGVPRQALEGKRVIDARGVWHDRDLRKAARTA